jgi:putative phage-type endonuclease
VTATEIEQFVDRSIEGADPGTAEWYSYMTASKIAAVMGHSKWDSWFSLWHKMNRDIPPEADNDEKRRGHYLEPAVRNWWADQFPEYEVSTTRFWVHPEIPWAGATPDGIAVHRETGARVLLECKSDAAGIYGEPGSDVVPEYYFDQVQWAMECTGIRTTHLAVINQYLEFNYYVVNYDPAYTADMIARAEAFMMALTMGVKPSVDPLDGHTATYDAIMTMHPEIQPDKDVVLGEAEAVRAIRAHAAVEAAKKELQAAKNVIADKLGNGHKATWSGKTIYGRQVRGDSKPFLVIGRSLPPIPDSSSNTNEGSEAA